MLNWLSGSGPERDQYTGFADDSKIPEPPETPAAVFALRALRSAVMGTPKDAETEDDLTVPIKSVNPGPFKRDNKALDKQDEPPLLPKPDQSQSQQPVLSPTKSILLTPGTTAARRKTVSFGDGVVDNERKKSLFSLDNNNAPNFTGNISSQWPARQLEANSRSRFTQSLLDARDKKPEKDDDDELFDIIDRNDKHRPKEPAPAVEPSETPQIEECNEDETMNLEEPRSQSGVYWKSEYENYKNKTSREIKKLIQYRSMAKSYARKKEAEATRLAQELRDEEAKVAGMEKRVSELAAGLMDHAKDGKSSNDKMVKELSEETALAVEYKEKVNSFRQALEEHGILEDDVSSRKNGQLEAMSQKLRETQEALDQATANIKKHKAPGDEIKQLQTLAESSEHKSNELEKENLALKTSLARVKETMSKYEDRRRAKEARLKQREAKLEEQLRNCRKQHKEDLERRESRKGHMEQSYRRDKKRLQATIDSLVEKLSLYEQTSPFRRRKMEEERARQPQNVFDEPESDDDDDGYGYGYDQDQGRNRDRDRGAKALADISHNVRLNGLKIPTFEDDTHTYQSIFDDDILGDVRDYQEPDDTTIGPIEPEPVEETVEKPFFNINDDNDDGNTGNAVPKLKPTSRRFQRRVISPQLQPSAINLRPSSPPGQGKTSSSGRHTLVRSRGTIGARGTLPPDRIAAAKARLRRKQGLERGR